jgi:DNA-directed RNA polymerase specialized sigma24 family protein
VAGQNDGGRSLRRSVSHVHDVEARPCSQPRCDPGHRRENVGSSFCGCIDATVRAYNPSREPKVDGIVVYPRTSVDPFAHFMAEINSEPEFAEPDAVREAARTRLDDADLVQRVLFEMHMRGQPERPPLRQTGRFAGRAYWQLFDGLWLYAWPVIRAFIRTNRMGQVLRRYAPGRSVAISPEDQLVLCRSPEECDALAIDVIAAAVQDFEKYALKRRRWSPTGGASLRTWFIGTCSLVFPRAYHRWSKDRGSRLDRAASRHGVDLKVVAYEIAACVPDPEAYAVDRAALRNMIEKAQPMTKVILGMIMSGLTHAQIAAELGLSVRAVEGRMYRFRTRVLADQGNRARWVSYRTDARRPVVSDEVAF